MRHAWNGLMQAFRDLDEMVRVVETWLTVVLLVALLGLCLYRAGMGWAGAPAVPADPLLGALVLWLLMLAATRSAAGGRVWCRKDLGPDCAPDLPGAFGRLLCLLAGLVSLLLMWASLKYWALDLQLGAAWSPGLSSSVVLAAIPLGFSLMAARFFARALARAGEPAQPSAGGR